MKENKYGSRELPPVAPQYGQTSNVKPLTANCRTERFVVCSRIAKPRS